MNREVCGLLGHRWTRPEGPSAARVCVRCGRLRTWWSATVLAEGIGVTSIPKGTAERLSQEVLDFGGAA